MIQPLLTSRQVTILTSNEIMEICILDSYEEISRRAAAVIISQLEIKKDLLLCAATGNSPGGTYGLLAEEYDRRPGLFAGMRVLKLDEWGGLPITDPGTCESYLQRHLLAPLQIGTERYLSFDSDPADPEMECRRMREELINAGPVDCSVIGIGVNGHIALNEPADILQPDFHVAKLAATTLQHSMIEAMERRPAYGLTLGVGNILKSRTILLLISGASKKNIVRELLSKKVTTSNPASLLWLHPNAICLLDREAAG